MYENNKIIIQEVQLILIQKITVNLIKQISCFNELAILNKLSKLSLTVNFEAIENH